MVAYKYLIGFPVPEPYKSKIIALMDCVASRTRVPSPRKLPPHVTFHRPLVGLSEREVLDRTESMILQARGSRITVTHFHHFDENFFVLPVHCTLGVAKLWSGIHNLLSTLPAYEHARQDEDNTLHITIAENMRPHFSLAWPVVRQIEVEEMHIPLDHVQVWGKRHPDALWSPVKHYRLRSED